jgi:hypothetical protein
MWKEVVGLMQILGWGWYRAGWLGEGQARYRLGKWWVWIGPYVIGYVRNF